MTAPSCRLDTLQVRLLDLKNGEQLRFDAATERHLVLTDGAVSLALAEGSPQLHLPTELLSLPAGMPGLLTAHATPTRLVLIEQQGPPRN